MTKTFSPAKPHPCNVCGTECGEPIYTSSTEQSLTSLCAIRPGRIKVWLCQESGHLSGEPFEDVEAFYEEDYKILLNDDDEDQVYEERDGKMIYRTDQQIEIIHEKLDLPAGLRILDFGCAKAAMAKRLLAAHPELDMNLFDVSHMYQSYWRQFVSDDHVAIHNTPEQWNRSFDLVMSYFAFEHIPEPAKALSHVAQLLKDGGRFYGVVPHVFDNIADFVVIDHVNHFTVSSMARLLADAGFGDIDIDTDSHRGAMVFSARLNGAPMTLPKPDEWIVKARKLAAYWAGIADMIRREEQAADGPAAIYGSGFYGSYILNSLSRPDEITCFVDKNPYLQGRSIFDKPIMPPDALPSEISRLYAGVNPTQARTILSGQNWMDGRSLDIIFLDETGRDPQH